MRYTRGGLEKEKIGRGHWEMDKSEIHVKRINAKEVFTSMNEEKFIFPIADATKKLSGEDQDLRISILIRNRPERREEQGHLPRESDGSSSSPLQDSSFYDGEARNDFWSILDKIRPRQNMLALSSTASLRESTWKDFLIKIMLLEKIKLIHLSTTILDTK